jgi:hypothetical protein
MKKLITVLGLLVGALRRGVRDFANEAVEEIVYMANEARIEGDWIMLAPYGEFRNAKGLQRITKADAESLANEYNNSLLSMPTRMLGVPIFKGHPDHEHFKNRDQDTMAYGRVKKLEARPEGLFANAKWGKKGRELIEDEAFSHPSANFGMVPRGDGSWRPVRLNSVGLTNNPNLPVPPISMANEEQNFMDRKKLAKRLGLAEDATDEQIDAALAQRETALANEQTARQTAETNFANEQAETKRLKAGLQTAEAAAKAARTKAAGVLIAAAMSAGKVLAAEKAQWETDFANATDFDSVATKLEGLKPKIHTKAKSEGLGQRNTQGPERVLKVQDFVNERMEKHGEDYLTAYRAVKAAKPDLFTEEAA